MPDPDSPSAPSSEPTLPPSPAAPHTDSELRGVRLRGRFLVGRLLGAGAHGTVYEARDELSERTVAIKMLPRLDPEALFRFKREFRVLTDLSHPNLVTLHELFVDERGAFFTMELVPGTDFMSWVRGEELEVVDLARLRSALRQLAAGLHALHAAGRLHRDLKPSNVLVQPDGRVLVADFGLVAELHAGHRAQETVGTPAYMSPEQAVGETLSPASDWYSVGVMLYEALTGSFPFAGARGMAMLLAKQGERPPSASSIAPGIPEDLDALCDELLARDPAARPSGADLLARLGSEHEAHEPAAWPSLALPVLGREALLDRLRAALDATGGSPPTTAAVALVRGRSGAGKSALVERFVQVTSARVLHGRCYERESVPYKGLDALVDALRVHLLGDRSSRAPAHSIAGGAALVRQFPVLADVPGLAAFDAVVPSDPIERRRQAVAALGELFARMARHEPVVLVIEDLQWCDQDTAAVLTAILRPADRPPVLLLGTYRDEDLEHSPALRELLEGLAGLGPVPVVEVEVGPLDQDTAIALARRIVGTGPRGEALARAIAAQAEGSPLLVTELARAAQAGLGDSLPTETPDLDAVIRARAARLPPEARRLLQIVALAGGPTEQAVVLEAADLSGSGLEMLATLRSRALVSTHGPRASDRVEIFHDRIGRAIAGELDAHATRLRHARLAQALERHGADPEALAVHFRAAGDTERALEYVQAAATAAMESLAFKRAARLHALGLELLPPGDRRRVATLAGLGDALAHDGRSAAAAQAYLRAADAAEEGDRDRVLELRRAAAEHLLRSGRMDEGLAALRRVLDELRLYSPPNPRVSLLAFMGQRARNRLRGYDFSENTVDAIDRDALLRVDASGAAATGLLQSNVLMGQYFQAKHLQLALDAGEPRRIARALGMEAMYTAMGGSESVTVTDALLERVQGLSRRLDDARATGIAELAAGITDLYRGRWLGARGRLQRAEEVLRSRCTSVQWEIGMARTFLIVALFYLGEMRVLRETMAHALEDAEERDDLHSALMVRVAWGALPALLDDDAVSAREAIASCRARFPGELDTSTYRYVQLLADTRLDRYVGDGAAAWASCERHWPAVVRSLMLTKQPFRTFGRHERGLCALAAAHASPPGRERRARLAVARADTRTLARIGTRFARAMALPLECALAAAHRERSEAIDLCTASVRAFEEAGMRAYAAAMRHRSGEIVGGSHGDSTRARAAAELTDLGIAAPDRFCDLLVPPVAGWDGGGRSA
jgi:tetratricopeptide (TPR) repeat protein